MDPPPHDALGDHATRQVLLWVASDKTGTAQVSRCVLDTDGLGPMLLGHGVSTLSFPLLVVTVAVMLTTAGTERDQRHFSAARNRAPCTSQTAQAANSQPPVISLRAC